MQANHDLPLLVVLATLLLMCCQSSATKLCTTTLSGPISDDVLVNGASCTLSSAIVSGSVTVRSGGTLTTTDSTVISGSVNADDSGDIVLSGSTTLQGVLKSENSPGSTVVLTSGATASSVELIMSGALEVSGGSQVGGILSDESGSVRITDGGSVSGGGIAKKKGSGDICLCSATIDGSISISEVTASGNSNNKLETRSGCGGSTTLSGSVLVEKSGVDVDLKETDISSGDVIIVEVTGSITLQDVTVSDVSLKSVTGSVRLSDVSTDSDVEMTLISGGSVELLGCSFSGDVLISQCESSITVSECEFGDEDVLISGNSGAVRVSGSVRANVGVTENEDSVIISGNRFDRVLVSKNNNGGVTIVGNVMEEVVCDDNRPPPNGSGNRIRSAQGQCVGF